MIKPQKLWPVYVLLVLLLGAYQGLNELIPLRSIPQLAAWKPFIWDMTSVVVIAAPSSHSLSASNTDFRLDFGRGCAYRRRARRRCSRVLPIVHTSVMVLLRKLIYWLAGDFYTFGNVLIMGFYELQKDLITYAIVLD